MPIEPSDNEHEYFKRQELDRLRKAREEANHRTAAAERERLKTLHWMRCPKCGLELESVEFRGVIVDACFGCGGMFFDQGEVEKLDEHQDKGTLGRMLTAFFGMDRR